jgi:hypothetical protein
VSIELGAKDVNQLRVMPNKDKGNNIILCTLVTPTSLTKT